MENNTMLESAFATDVYRGLKAKNKHISSKYFYNTAGDKIFQDIMNMPEYYLTRCEYEILNFNKEALRELFIPNTGAFRLIELGAGDGLKTKVLLKYFSENKTHFQYHPVDISANILDELLADIKLQIPGISVSGLNGDYFNCLEKLKKNDGVRKVVLMLGSNIGNYNYEDAIEFLRGIRKSLSLNDLLLIGFDLKKNPDVILNAYNDNSGITKAFNLNLLQRINDELQADFRLDNFIHYPVYDPLTGDCKSYLLSTKKQAVEIKELNITVAFEAWEPIYTEVSKKYNLKEIAQLAATAGFKLKQNFLDCKHYFADSLWEVI